MSVREDRVTRPDGKPGIYGVVTMHPGICILPIDDENNIYLVKQYRYGVERETLEAIAGGTEGQDILDTAKRELLEETGISAKTITPLGFIDPFTSIVNSPDYIFVAQNLSFGDPEREGTEHDMELIKIPYVRALQWVVESKITHAASVVAILKAREYLNTRNP